MNFRSIRFKLSAWFAVLLFFVIGCFGTYTYERSWRYQEQVLLDALGHRAKQIERLFQEIPKNGEAWAIDKIPIRFSPELNDRFIRVTNAAGQQLYISGTPNDRSFDPELIPPLNLQSPPPESRKESAPGEIDILINTRKAVVLDKTYWIEVGTSLATSYDILHGLGWTLAIGLPIVMGIAVAGSMIVLKRALMPVESLIRAAQEITLQHLTRRLPVPDSGDEITSLALALNDMIARIEKSFQNTSRFTSDASHELRTPLTIIRGELEAIMHHPELDDQLREDIASLQEETERLVRIVEGLFALARLDAGESKRELKRFDLSLLAATTVEQMCMLAEEKSISIQCDTNADIQIEGDESRLKQVIVNLIDNAIKYTQTGGEIKVSVTASDKDALLEIIDNGSGIPETAIPHIFERFYRADEARSRAIDGAGIGLSIAHSICTAHSGSIEVKSKLGVGSHFIVRLPHA
mgnify:CR=1 FL=1